MKTFREATEALVAVCGENGLDDQRILAACRLLDQPHDDTTTLAGYCYALVDGFDAWYYRCRCCDGTSPGVNLRHVAEKTAVAHKPGCPVARHTLPKVTTNA